MWQQAIFMSLMFLAQNWKWVWKCLPLIFPVASLYTTSGSLALRISGGNSYSPWKVQRAGIKALNRKWELLCAHVSVCVDFLHFPQFAFDWWRTHQIHLCFLQLFLLLPQFLTMQQLHTEVLTRWVVGDIQKRTFGKHTIVTLSKAAKIFGLKTNKHVFSFCYLLVDFLVVWMEA